MVASPSTETASAPKAELKPLLRNAISFFESRHVHWSATVPNTVTREDLLLPSLWSVVADQFHVYDRVFVLSASRSFAAELMVLECSRGFAQVVELNYWPLPAILVTSDNLPSGFSVEYLGAVTTSGTGGYCARRICDSVLICQGHTSRDACVAELLNHASLR